jgi:Zn-dependent protease/CBS domain-containing protein
MRSYTLLRIWDIPIRINVSLLVFLPILAYLIGTGTQIEFYAGLIETFTTEPIDVATLREGNTPWLVGLAAGIGLFASVLVHELGHSWVGRRYGLHVESITLWILGGLASFSEFPKEWQREFWIAIAGPITSLGLGVVCLGALQGLGGASPVLVFLLGWVGVTNVVLAVFNLLPAFPMDGGRILRSLLARNRSYASATRVAARIGVGFAFLFAVVGILQFSPLLLLLAWFLYGAATTESRITTMTELLEGITVGDVARRDTRTVEAGDTLADFTNRMIREKTTVYPVTRGGRIVGVVSLADLKRANDRDHDTATVADVMSEDVPRLAVSSPAFEALELFGRTEEGVVFVEEGSEVVGVVSSAEIGEVLQFQRESEFGARLPS